MPTLEVRPYAAMTNDDLATLSRSVARCSDDLGRQQVSIQAELELRMLAQRQELNRDFAGHGKTPTLQYLSSDTAVAKGLTIGDSYADAARRFAMKWVAIGIGLPVVIFAIICIVMERWSG